MADRSLDPTVVTELFCRYQRGDEQAFTTLYRQLARPLLAYCLSFTSSTEGAYDLLHHTLALVVEKRTSFSNGNALAWIFTIARNAGRTLEARERRQERVADEADFDHVARKSGHDAAPQWDADELAIVTNAVGHLAKEFREVVYLFYYADMAVDDIADTIGITSNLVRVRLHRARALLKPILKPLMPDSHG